MQCDGDPVSIQESAYVEVTVPTAEPMAPSKTRQNQKEFMVKKKCGKL